MPGFWHAIHKKTTALANLEERVFGCDDLWRHIKAFIFSPTICWAAAAGCTDPCHGKPFISYVQKHRFRHFRQGAIKNGIYTTKTYTCGKHVYSGANPNCIVC